MYQFVTLCVVLFIVQQYAADQVIAGYEYKDRPKAWLRLHNIPATWADARQRCHLEGGVLVSPTTYVLKEALISMMEHDLSENAIVFTGIHGGISKGDFVSIEGVPLADTVLEWADGEPTNANNEEDCLAMNREGRVSDESCKRVLPYFCRKENQVLNKKCSSTDAEYVWEPRTDSCYRFHRVARTWHNAAKACSASLGHLAIINSAKEAQVITEIFAKNPMKTIVGATNPNYALLGFWTWYDKDNEWLTIHGQTLAEAGYEKWKKGEPNNYMMVGEYCGAVWRRGGFNDVTCVRQRYPFICETTAVAEPTTTEAGESEEQSDEYSVRKGAAKSKKLRSRLDDNGVILPPMTAQT